MTQAGGAQATSTPTATTAPGSIVYQGTVQITTIKSQGGEPNEADEYVEIHNNGNQPVYLDGWSLKAIRASDNQIIDQYTFTNGFVIVAGQTCRIYTNKNSTADNCGTGFGFENPAPLWPNTPGARASLRDKGDVEYARFSY